ncbi:hypothetical protein M0802_013408 [Mischocyttarus mexicanus]|nr:hypothetical protein M0802_013408 [Mischocyttarus mexicanus]
MFDSLVKGVMLYGAKLFGWAERAELESVQQKYIRWCLGLDYCTPGYIILEETKRDKIRIGAGQRALRFEEGVRKAKGRTLVKESLKEKEKGIGRTRNGKEKEDFFKRNGFSQRGIDHLRQQKADVNMLIKERNREIQGQIQNNKIREARYNPRFERLRTVARPEYLSKRGEGGSQKLIARARCGNIEENNKYWLNQDKRRCTLCGAEAGTLKHLIDRCQKIKRTELKEEEILEGK